MSRDAIAFFNPLMDAFIVSHRCKNGKREGFIAPLPFWHTDETGKLAEGCSFECRESHGGCGLKVERWPIVEVPKSPAKDGRLRRTLNSWRRKR